MKSYDSFPGNFDYHQYLYRQARKDRLRESTVDQANREAMLESVLSPELPEGVYMEIGPAASPYCINSCRDFTRLHYVGIDGGKSQYDAADHKGWGERGHILENAVATVGKGLATPDRPLATFLWGDAQHLPFPDKEVNEALPIREVFMRDVLLEPGVHPRSIERIFHEQARILSENGTLIIRETTFIHYFHYIQEGLSPRFLSLLACLDRAGFTKRTTVASDDPAFLDFLRHFPGGDDDEIYPMTGYYIVCQQEGKMQNIEKLSWWHRLKQSMGRAAVTS